MGYLRCFHEWKGVHDVRSSDVLIARMLTEKFLEKSYKKLQKEIQVWSEYEPHTGIRVSV